MALLPGDIVQLMPGVESGYPVFVEVLSQEHEIVTVRNVSFTGVKEEVGYHEKHLLHAGVARQLFREDGDQ